MLGIKLFRNISLVVHDETRVLLRGRCRVREKQTVKERERCYREIEGREADRERERERESIERLTVKEREVL